MIRSLLKNWKLNSIAVFSLAIAMGLSVVALSLSNLLLLRPPVASDPGRLVTIFTISRSGERNNLSYPDYQYLRDHNRAFSGIAGYTFGISKEVIRLGAREQMSLINSVTDDYFSLLGIEPFLGRLFSPGDDGRKLPEAVLTYAGWKRWGADPHVVGKTLVIHHRTVPIVGVAPKSFLGPVVPIAADVILNLANEEPATLENREYRLVLLAGRLQPESTRAQARMEMQELWSQLTAAYPGAERNPFIETAPTTLMHPDNVHSAQLISAILMAVVLLILLVACANVANLLLALATQRRQEALIKTALGATRKRLVLEFLKESTVICAAGGALGYFMAAAVLAWLSRFDASVPVFGPMQFAADLHPGTLVMALTCALTVFVSFAAGLAPALYASKINLAGALSGEIAIGGTRRGLIRSTVVVVQVAVCTLVLAGTGLCLRSLHNLRNVDPGFTARNIVSIWMFDGLDNLSKEAALKRRDEVRKGAEKIFGVESVSISQDMPLGGDTSDREELHFAEKPGERIFVECTEADENYFSTFGIRLLSGRTFRESDQENSPAVIVINHLLAEQYWPHADPVGRTVRMGKANREMTVIGVVADGKYDDLDEAPRPYFYRAIRQNYEPECMLIARTHGDPKLWVEPLSRMARELGVTQPMPAITMESWLRLTLFVPLTMLACVAGLSVLALLLAAVGLYGAISYSVGERRGELGIRVALGARPGQLLTMVFRETLKMAGPGVAAGLALGIAAGTLLASHFYGLRRFEWTVGAPVAAGMVALSLVIAYLASRRWVCMDALDTIRHV